MCTNQRYFIVKLAESSHMLTDVYPERLRELAKSYYFKNTKKKSKNLVILVHGFGASATETRPLGEFLYSEGYDVKGILLKGHGTKPVDMDSIRWEEWIDDIQEAYDEHASKYTNIIVGGISMGGALALYSSTQIRFKAIFTINAFYHLSKTLSFATWFFSLFGTHRQRNEARIKWYVENNLFSYSDDSTPAANQLYKMLKTLHKKVGEINIPVLIIQSKEDRTAKPEGAEELFEDLKTQKELFFVQKGDHILTVDPHKQEAFDKILLFLEDIVKN
ncbi:MAG: alpha/beta hydrolase [Candidatus Heimdallarchaeota archaeon]|nr:alpha/beta hydrolase [Candidatus Heimdallarchaeota archaeon]